ncbi:hypothetical protein H4Q26_004313 [Puccinia striiformis f. sp. tritici PST-130]|nr:hypothetical protein Pst134EB_023666 [Puccinia striiformis f. sp. tritici]KAI9605943.1 hypothetical protein H4Q26_004313 [Puccinia striiformis f. sp. tritici PST-130]
MLSERSTDELEPLPMERATDLKALTLGITSAPSPSTVLVHPITNFSKSVIPPMNPPQGSAYTKVRLRAVSTP